MALTPNNFPAAVRVIQDQSREIKALKDENKGLKAEVKKLQKPKTKKE